MNDVKCPYCGAGQEIHHDDGYGYEENQLHNQKCRYCEKTFAYTTAISFDYEAYKADCLNDGDHIWVQIVGFPKEFFVGKYRCRLCGEVQILDKEAHRAALTKYHKELDHR